MHTIKCYKHGILVRTFNIKYPERIKYFVDVLSKQNYERIVIIDRFHNSTPMNVLLSYNSHE